MKNPLDNSRPLDVHRWSDYPEAKSACEAIFEEFRAQPNYRGDPEKLKKHLRVLLIDLYKRYLEDPAGYLQYSRNSGKYGLDERYNKLFIKYDPLIRAVDFLSGLGYIEGEKGFFDRESGSSRESRMRATPKLIEVLTGSHGMEPGSISSVGREVIILRDRAKKPVPYTDDAETNRMRDVIKRYTSQLEATYIDVILKGYRAKQTFDINLNDKYTRRIFNNSSWKEGGRFYGGWWQRIPSDLRRRIVIYGKETIEIDYSSIHIAILYAIRGVDYFGSGRLDPYSIPGYPGTTEYRTLFKLILLTVLNSSDEKAAKRAVQFEMNKSKWDFPSGVKIQEAIKAFESVHP